GTRLVLSTILLALGLVVVRMSQIQGEDVCAELFLLVLLTRGLGQSALSVVSLALVGKTAGRHSGPMIGVYSFLVAIGFSTAFDRVKWGLEVQQLGWRSLWADIGYVLMAAAPVAWILVRRQPTSTLTSITN